MKKNILFIALVLGVCLVGCGQNVEADSQEAQTTVQDSISAPKEETSEIIKSQEAQEDEEQMTEQKEIQITSESLTADGKWMTKINAESASPKGENLSPQLTFDAVEGASMYAIYMFDTSAGNWLHWKIKGTDKTSLAEGEVIETGEYVGPYPPSGVHTYVVTVYALKGEPEKYMGAFDSSNASIEKIETKLDTIDGQPGNILAKGSISGEVTSGGAVVE